MMLPPGWHLIVLCGSALGAATVVMDTLAPLYSKTIYGADVSEWAFVRPSHIDVRVGGGMLRPEAERRLHSIVYHLHRHQHGGGKCASLHNLNGADDADMLN